MLQHLLQQDRSVTVYVSSRLCLTTLISCQHGPKIVHRSNDITLISPDKRNLNCDKNTKLFCSNNVFICSSKKKHVQPG